MQNLFAYGTLMCEDIRAEVSGSLLFCEPGILKGFSRSAVKGDPYPSSFFDDFPVPVLRAIKVTANEATKEKGITIFENMRVPEHSIVPFAEDIIRLA